MKKHSLLNILVIALTLSPLIYIAIIWHNIPDVIPTHYNQNMEADKTGSKNFLWIISAVMAAVNILVYLLLTNLHLIDPKRRKAPPSIVFQKFAVVLLLFLTALNFIIVISMATQSNLIDNAIFPLMGLMFAFIGNYMNNIKPNYFAGFRLPWTLSDDENWRKTHHLASKIWFVGGILLAVISFFLPFEMIIYVFVAVVLIMTLIPSIYSYKLFKEKDQ